MSLWGILTKASDDLSRRRESKSEEYVYGISEILREKSSQSVAGSKRRGVD